MLVGEDALSTRQRTSRELMELRSIGSTDHGHPDLWWRADGMTQKRRGKASSRRRKPWPYRTVEGEDADVDTHEVNGQWVTQSRSVTKQTKKTYSSREIRCISQGAQSLSPPSDVSQASDSCG